MVCDYNKNKEEIDNLEGKEIHLVRGGTCVNIEIPRQLFFKIYIYTCLYLYILVIATEKINDM